MDKKLEELLDWMFFNNGIMEATAILSNLLAPVQRDSVIEELEALKKKKEEKQKMRTIELAIKVFLIGVSIWYVLWVTETLPMLGL